MNTLKKGFMFYLAFIMLALAVPLLIVSINVNVYSGSLQLYTDGFARYHISEVTGISTAQLKDVARGMVDYFAGKLPSPQVQVDIRGQSRPVYSQKELIHLEDVGKIIDIFKMLGVLSLVIFLVAGIYLLLKWGAGWLIRGLQAGAIATVALLGSIMLWALVDFNSIFYFFHILSFSNDLWLLDPAKDYLIMMFPEGFFFDSAVLIVATIIGAAVVIWIAASVVKRFWLPAPK
jgi:integral membrane protein (TIGR01906 family)